MVSGDDVLMDPKGVPSMVETTALIDDTVGGDETSEPRTCDGVTISEVRAGLALSAEKDAEEAAVELRPSIDESGVGIPNVGLVGSRVGKDWYNGANESLCLAAEKGSVLRCFLGESAPLDLGSMVKANCLRRRKGVRLCNDSPEPTSGPSPRSRRDLRKGRGSATVNA
jgi:hypothetical protein